MRQTSQVQITHYDAMQKINHERESQSIVNGRQQKMDKPLCTKVFVHFQVCCGDPPGIRTQDPLIKSCQKIFVQILGYFKPIKKSANALQLL